MLPAVELYEYQKRWIDDDSRFAIGLKARQIGYTWGTMLGIVLDCIPRRTSWYFLSTTERQAEEAMEEARTHSEAMGLALSIEESFFEDTRYRQLSIVYPNKSKIVGLPSNPRTARGSHGNVVLDEFAHHQDGAKIWTALYPVVTRGYKVRVLSTPNGRQGKFYELWDAGKGWSRHRTDIYEAVAQGFAVDLEELRAGCGTEEDWQQEYCCEFLDEAKAWLPFSLIESAYHEGASLSLDSSIHPTGPLWLGVDVARKRDLTVLWLNEQRGDVHWTRAVLALAQTKFSEQREAIDALMPMVRRGCIDANGIGAQLAEEAQERWSSLVEPVMMSGQVPAMIATRVKDEFERGRMRIPDDADIRRDLHQVRKTHTAAGNVRFEAPRTKDGHADRFWALGLALHASDLVQVRELGYQTVQARQFAALGGEARSPKGPHFPGGEAPDAWRGY